MARRKPRLTPKKKPVKAMDQKNPNGISKQQFDKLKEEYSSFAMEDPHHNQHTFHKGDTAYIQHQDLEDDATVVPEDDYWIGTVSEIRADGPDEVWVRVQWLWSPQEVAEVIKSFDPTVCGKYEKLTSDNFDILSAHCFVTHVDVKRFDETSICQVPITEDEWFVRYNFLYGLRRISPKITHVACPICKVPYTPGEEKTLHFCPRPGCRKFYHQSCLVRDGYVETTRTRRVLETWPDVDRTVSVESLAGTCPPRKRQKTANCPTWKESKGDVLAGLPPQLIAVAGQQIVRGTRGGGVVGNVAPVVAARQLIFNILRGSGVIPDDWESTIDISAAAFSETETLPNCTCPNCYSPI